MMTSRSPLAWDASRSSVVRLSGLGIVVFGCALAHAGGMDHTLHTRTRPATPDRAPVSLHHTAATAHAAPASSRSSKAHSTRTAVAAKPVAKGHVQAVSTSRSHVLGPAHVQPLIITTVVHNRHEIGRPAVKPAVLPVTKTVTPSKPAPVKTATVTAKPLPTSDVTKPAAPPATYSSEGISHPDELDDEATLAASVVVKHPAELPKVSAAPAPVAPTATERVDGFGAEGVPAAGTHRTLAATMASHRNDPLLTAKTEMIPTAVEREEITEEAMKPMVLPAIYNKAGRLVMPAPLKGSHDVLVHQNTMADAAGLERIQDDDALEHLISTHELVRLPESPSLQVNGDLPIERRYARPWTVRFATETAKAFNQHFGDAIRINSAVRTVSYQLRLTRVNGNAAGVSGESASPHLTGQAIDIGKRGMSQSQLAWMRAYLAPLMDAGKIDVEEEFKQACFHISVYRSYLPAVRKAPKIEVASAEKPVVHPRVAATSDADRDQ